MLTFPHLYYDFSNLDDVIGNSSEFTGELFDNYYSLLINIYKEEYFMKKLKHYDIVTDLFSLHYILVKIHLVILSTSQDERLTYSEYLEMYHGDCIFKRLVCEGVDPKKLMIAFDSGYANINNISTIIAEDDTAYDGGIGWFRISGTTSQDDDFIIS